MTDTGQGPGEGLPENAGRVEQPGVSAPAAYSYLGPSETTADDDDLLLLPGAQGAWVESPPAAPMPPATHEPGAHEMAGRDSGSVDVSAVRTPPPAVTHTPPPVQPRRPLHLGPPTPDTSGSLVRSLADRGPAGAPVRPTGPPTSGPEYLDVPRESAPAVHTLHTAPRSGDGVSQGGSPWGAPVNAETVVPGAGHVPAPQAPGPVPAPEPAAAVSYPDPQGAPETAQAAPAVEDGAPHLAPTADAEAQVAHDGAQTRPHAAEAHFAPPVPEADGSYPTAHTAQPGAHGDVHASHAGAPTADPAPTSAPNPGEPQPHRPDTGESHRFVPSEQPEHLAGTGEFPHPEDAFETTQPLRRVQIAEPAQTAYATEGAQPSPVVEAAHYAEAAHAEAEPAHHAFPEADAGPRFTRTADAPAVEVEPHFAEPEPVAPETAHTETVEPVEPEAIEPEAAHPEPAHHGVPEPEAAHQEVAEPDVARPVAVQPEAAQPDVAGPEPEAVQPHEQVPQSDAEFVLLDDSALTPLHPAPVPAPENPAEEPEAAPAPAPESAEVPSENPENDATWEAPVTAEASVTAEAPETAETEVIPETTQVAETPHAPETPAIPEAPATPEPAAAEESTDSTHTMEEPVRVPAQREAEHPAPADVPDVPEAVTPVPEPAVEEPVVAQQAEELQTRVAEQEESAPVAEETREPSGPAAPGYAEAEREAVLRVMRERRDIRNGFRSDPIPHDVLLRVLEAAHTAPSVGHSQPWDFVVIRSADTRRTMHELAMRQRDAYAKSLPKGRAKQFKELKIEAILDTPVNIVVTADPTRGGRHTLGRHTQPQMAPYSSALAVENLWLAARAEGLGVGWVSFFDEREMVRTLGLPEHLEVVAYLCVGYVDEFPDEPELLQAGWSKRRPLSWVVHEETYGRRALPGEEPHDLLAETVSNIRPLDAKALGEAWERQKRMTKPAGALGMLEIISAQLSGLSRQCPPPIPEPAAVAIFAGDHGVHAQGVTPWPQEVTGQMVANFLGGGAVCNAFANQVGAEVCIVDVGVASDLPATPGLLPRKVRAGTADMTTGPALTREEVKKAIEVGIETARDLVSAGNKALLTGEMGIANTTASAALIAVFTDTDPSEVTGRGTGINDETLARKTEVVRRAVELHQPDPADPIGVLAAVGGLEHAALVGLLLGGASLRTPVILDGVSAGAAALVARAIAPEVLAACIAGHRSAEPGHVAALKKLGLRPLVDLDLRLGEGTGALLALPLVQSAARAMHEVATFDSAGVTEK